MAKSTDLEKTWKPGPSTEQTFNAPGNVTVPYGRYKATVSGRGGSGNAPVGATWNTNYNTNYNTAYPIANQPIANQPAATWNTNYNTNYNVAYPVGNQPVTGFNPGNPGQPTYYNIARATTWTVQYFQNSWGNLNVPYPIPPPGFTPQGTYYQIQNFTPTPRGSPGTYQEICPPGNTESFWTGYTFWTQFQSKQQGLPASAQYTNVYAQFKVQAQIQSCTAHQVGNPGIPGNPNYTTNYNTVYPVANRPLANQPAATWNTNYSTNYNTAFPVANQPIANRPVATYAPGNAGQEGNAFGVKFPGGPVDLSGFGGNPGTATPITPANVNYYDYPDGVSHPVSVPPGGQVVVKIE